MSERAETKNTQRERHCTGTRAKQKYSQHDLQKREVMAGRQYIYI